MALPDDYLPRTNYVPACEQDEYQNAGTQSVPWIDCKDPERKHSSGSVTAYYATCKPKSMVNSGVGTDLDYSGHYSQGSLQ